MTLVDGARIEEARVKRHNGPGWCSLFKKISFQLPRELSSVRLRGSCRAEQRLWVVSVCHFFTNAHLPYSD